MGALLRYYLVLAVEHWNSTDLPAGVLFVNCAGSFFITLIAFYINHHTASLPAFLMPLLIVGMLGSFTTFSTFSMDNLRLVQNGQAALALFYSFLSVGGGLAFAWLGYWTAHKFAS